VIVAVAACIALTANVLIVVKVAAPGTAPPIVPGDAKVAPFKLDAFRFATFVVLLTVNGAVPVETVEVNVTQFRLVVLVGNTHAGVPPEFNKVRSFTLPLPIRVRPPVVDVK
jgi:hypothetical protein